MPFRSNPPTTEEQTAYSKMEKFINHLTSLPKFEIKLGRLQKIELKKGVSFNQKGVDIMLGVDLAKMSWDKQIQKAIIITADSDFVYAIKSAKEAGISTHLWYYNGKGRWNVNRTLTDEVDDRTIFSNSLLDKCKLD